MDECILEPGGTFFMRGKREEADEHRWPELVAKRDEVRAKLAALDERLPQARTGAA